MRDWKRANGSTHIQVNSLSLKTKLQALAEQRQESLNDTVKAVIEAGIVALTKDDDPPLCEFVIAPVREEATKGASR